MTKAARAALGFDELFDHLEVRLHHRHQHQLRQRSPTAMVKSVWPRFQQDTISGPW
jgi:hypothetical protein